MKTNWANKFFLFSFLGMVFFPVQADETGLAAAQDSTDPVEDQTWVYEGECDPVVKVVANQEKRFDLLRKLSDEHGFEIVMLAEEDKPVSMEKEQALSKVVESITRDMSVVLNYRKIDDCERLVAISIITGDGWSSSGRGASGLNNPELVEKLKQYKPKFKPIKIERQPNYDTYGSSPQRLSGEKPTINRGSERPGLEERRVLNEELPSGYSLQNTFNVRGKWKYEKEDIEDMNVYVDEVLDGKRIPNIRGMTMDQRAEYMRLRREKKNERMQAEENQ